MAETFPWRDATRRVIAGTLEIRQAKEFQKNNNFDIWASQGSPDYDDDPGFMKVSYTFINHENPLGYDLPVGWGEKLYKFSARRKDRAERLEKSFSEEKNKKWLAEHAAIQLAAALLLPIEIKEIGGVKSVDPKSSRYREFLTCVPGLIRARKAREAFEAAEIPRLKAAAAAYEAEWGPRRKVVLLYKGDVRVIGPDGSMLEPTTDGGVRRPSPEWHRVPEDCFILRWSHRDKTISLLPAKKGATPAQQQTFESLLYGKVLPELAQDRYGGLGKVVGDAEMGGVSFRKIAGLAPEKGEEAQEIVEATPQQPVIPVAEGGEAASVDALAALRAQFAKK